MQTPILYIPAIQKNLDIKLSEIEIKKLPKTLFLVYSIQYKNLAKSIKNQLERSKIKIRGFKQVLGCTKINTKLPILLISTGRFHAQNLFSQTPILYVLENNKILKIPEKEIAKLKAKKKTALMKFLKADKLGILVSTKPGQENLDKAIKLKHKLENKGKKAFIFISNNIDIAQFENFDINSWINTACPGLAIDNPDIININELPKL